MVEHKIMLSPCMICDNNKMYNWMYLSNILDFICQYLDCGLDTIAGSFYHEDSWYTPPVCDVNMHALFTTDIIPKLLKLLKKGTAYTLDDIENICDYQILNSDFIVTDEKQMDLVLKYTLHVNKDYILFVGKDNYGMNSDNLEISINGNNFIIPVVKDPYTEKSGHFDTFIKDNQNKDVFCNSDLCVQLDREMKDLVKRSNGVNSSLYKKYGEIIAKRNGYKKYTPQNPFYEDTKYFIRHDGKYIISIDLLHGHFEVFEGNSKQQWIGEYNFSGKKISPLNATKKQLNAMRNTHKIEK